MGNLSEKATVVFVNMTKQCNINCSRCFLTPSSRRESQRLPLLYLEKLLSHPKFSHKECVIMWEGGEPALIGERAFLDYIQLVKSILPHARQGIVTNLFHLPNWLVRIIETEFQGWCETTLALGKKATLNGSTKQYRERVRSNLTRLATDGIQCAVNIELNQETAELGVDALMAFIFSTGQKSWDFDISVDFPVFYDHPHYEMYYPVLPQTVSNRDVQLFLKDIYSNYRHLLNENQISIDPLTSIMQKRPAIAFNAARELDFYTLNPDGTVTSDPLFSDMPITYDGDLSTDTVDSIINSVNKQRRHRYETNRQEVCMNCRHFEQCRGGPSHVPVFDHSGECCGYSRLRDVFNYENESKLI